MNIQSRDLSGGTYRTTGDNSNRSTTGNNLNDLSKVLIGALAGAAAGSIIGVLFTEKGIEARKRVSEGSKNMAKNLKEKVSDITEGLADKYEAAKESAADLIERGKQKVGMSPDYKAYKGIESTGAKVTPTKVLLGALAVSLAGTIIWSFASEKGIKTRKRLGKGSKNMANNLKDKVSNIADGIADTYEAAKEGVADLLEKRKQQNDLSSGSTPYQGSEGVDAW